jgi:hypothetical protein
MMLLDITERIRAEDALREAVRRSIEAVFDTLRCDTVNET